MRKKVDKFTFTSLVIHPAFVFFTRALTLAAILWVASSFDKMRLDVNTIQITLGIKLKEYDDRLNSLEAWRVNTQDKRL